MKLATIIAGIGIVGALTSCKTPAPNSQSKAIYTEPARGNAPTLTWARLPALANYGNDLLNETEVQRDDTGKVIRRTGRLEPLHVEASREFRHLGLKPEAFLPLNKQGVEGQRGNYLLYLAEDSRECFWERGLFDRDIAWGNHLRQIKSQLESIARFIKEFHVAIQGDIGQGFVFNRVELCSKKKKKRVLAWQPGGKLEVRIPYQARGAGFSYSPVDSRELMRLWQSGDIFSESDATQKMLKRGWGFFNPASAFRMEIIKKFRTVAAKIVDRIRALRGGSALLAQDAEELVRRHVDAGLLGYDPLEALARVNAAGKQDRFLELWEEFSADPGNHEAIINASPGAASEKIKVRNHAKGWLVSVANYHRVAVQGSINSGVFKRYLTVDNPREVDIDLECTGAIAVCTIDDITVFIDFIKSHVSFDKSLETAGFDAAIQATVGAPDSRSEN